MDFGFKLILLDIVISVLIIASPALMVRLAQFVKMAISKLLLIMNAFKYVMKDGLILIQDIALIA